MNVFWTIGRGVARLLDVAAALLLLAVLAIILAQIVARYVIGVSMPCRRNCPGCCLCG
jgi:TRAP-type C4-dicarboxylate transport system permease small subunit